MLFSGARSVNECAPSLCAWLSSLTSLPAAAVLAAQCRDSVAPLSNSKKQKTAKNKIFKKLGKSTKICIPATISQVFMKNVYTIAGKVIHR